MKRARSTVAAGLCVLALAGCQAATAGAPGAQTSSPAAPSTPPVSLAQISVTPTDAATGVRPDASIHVAVARGSISTVSARTAAGVSVPGSVDAAKSTWTSSGALAVATQYSVTVAAVDDEGVSATQTTSFSTLTPAARLTAHITPGDSWVVGVGMPIVVQFNRSIPQDRRADVQRHLTVTATPATEGAWRWVSGTQVQYRTRNYWTSGTKVVVAADLVALEGAPGVWGTARRTSSFGIGSATISTVDVAAHTLTMRRAGQVVRVVPVTTGKSGNGGKYLTRNGIKVIISRESRHRMDAASTGTDPADPEYYNLDVQYAMRLTWSGEFLHAAPWSVGAQGRANVSHGCTGLSVANARWLFQNSKAGDVVKYVNSSRGLERDNGYTMWNMPFDVWKTGSAL